MIKRLFLIAIFLFSVGGASVVQAEPQPQPEPQTAPATSKDCNGRLLTFPTWYRGLTDGSCDIVSPADVGGISSFIWTIVLNVIEAMLQAVGYLSFGFILYGGFRYITGGGILNEKGSSTQIVGARKTIVNAVVGLILSFMAVLIVNVVVDRLTK